MIHSSNPALKETFAEQQPKIQQLHALTVAQVMISHRQVTATVKLAIICSMQCLVKLSK